MKYQIIAMVAALLIMIGQYIKIQGLKADLAEEQTARVVAEANVASLRGAVENQNAKIKSIEVDRDKNLTRYEELKKQPEKVRYRVIYEHISKLDTKSDECEDIKELLDEIRKAGY